MRGQLFLLEVELWVKLGEQYLRGNEKCLRKVISMNGWLMREVRHGSEREIKVKKMWSDTSHLGELVHLIQSDSSTSGSQPFINLRQRMFVLSLPRIGWWAFIKGILVFLLSGVFGFSVRPKFLTLLPSSSKRHLHLPKHFCDQTLSTTVNFCNSISRNTLFSSIFCNGS